MTNFEQYIQYRALACKFSGSVIDKRELFQREIDKGHFVRRDQNGVLRTIVGIDEVTPNDLLPAELRNVCAKLDSLIVDRLDRTLDVLGMTKRDFIELALVEALDKSDQILSTFGVSRTTPPPQESSEAEATS
jgi:hypothetical protein